MIPPRVSSFLLALALTASINFKATAADDYKLGPDSFPQEDVPRGEVTKMPAWTRSAIFPGTQRDWWIYVPTQYDASKPTPFMVFMDGGGYVSTNGQWRVPVVFDNLIHKKEIPALIGVFIGHSRVKALGTNALDRFNRSYEYDGLGDNYARFVLAELLPEV